MAALAPTARPDKPVRSAEAVAALRAASVREADPAVRNPDHLARLFVRGRYRFILALPSLLGRHLIERITPGSYCYFLARTRFVDDQLLLALRRGVRQVVILGAGYDSRALRFAEPLRDALVFEVDLPSTQRAKRQRLSEAGIATPPNLRFVGHDFHERALIDALQAEGFSTALPTFFIWEGVTYYLAESAVVQVLDSVVSRCARGSSIALDYSLRSFVDGDESTYGGATMQRWLARNGERFRFGLEQGQLAAFLRPFDLTITEDLGSEVLCRQYLTDTRRRSLGRPLGHLRLAHAVRG